MYVCMQHTKQHQDKVSGRVAGSCEVLPFLPLPGIEPYSADYKAVTFTLCVEAVGRGCSSMQ